MANTVSVDALRREVWAMDLYKDVMDNLYFTANGMMGVGSNNIIEIKDDLSKQKGDTITVGLTAKLSGNGVSGDNELEGNEEAISAYSDQILIDQKRFGVRLTGLLDEQKNAYDMRQDAKEKLAMRMQEFIERQFFLKLAGVGHAALTDVAGVVISADYGWSNTGNAVPAADSANGYGARYICADYTNGADSLATTDLLTPELISRAKIKATLASPKIQPLRIDGKDFYLMFIHPWQAFDLKNNATYAQAQREAAVRGEKNPIFTGALGVWDGVIVHEHEYVPYLDIDVVGNNFAATGSGTDISADCFRALLVGRQAGVFARSKFSNGKAGWVEKTFDYDNQTGFATRLIGGIQKLTFNSKDYGVICVDTAATALV